MEFLLFFFLGVMMLSTIIKIITLRPKFISMWLDTLLSVIIPYILMLHFIPQYGVWGLGIIGAGLVIGITESILYQKLLNKDNE